MVQEYKVIAFGGLADPFLACGLEPTSLNKAQEGEKCKSSFPPLTHGETYSRSSRSRNDWAGHSVTLASHPVMKTLVESHGVTFAPIDPPSRLPAAIHQVILAHTQEVIQCFKS